jgi:hypothetical protein
MYRAKNYTGTNHFSFFHHIEEKGEIRWDPDNRAIICTQTDT